MAIAPATTTTAAPAATPHPATGGGSAGSDAYVRNVLAVSLAKNVLDVARSVVKLPEAARAGRLGPALVQAFTASPTTNLIDPRAPRVATAASGGRSFTALDETAYRAASVLAVGLGAFQVATGVPNIVHAVRDGGPSAVYDTREGREGALQVAGGAITLGTYGRAVGVAKAAGVGGPVAVALAAASSPALASPLVIGSTLATSGLVFLNGRGFLDFMNRGETRSFSQVERDSWDAMDVPGKLARTRDHAVRMVQGTAQDVEDLGARGAEAFHKLRPG